MAHSLSTSLLALSFLKAYVRAICYYPDGKVTNSDVACLSGDEESWCCGFGYACLSNKICMTTPQNANPSISTYCRGSCTDPTWRSNNCPNFCVNPDAPDSDDTDGGEGMALCANTTNTFVCEDFWGSIESACVSNIAVQATGTYSILTTIGYGSPSISSSTTTSTVASTTSGSSNSFTSTTATALGTSSTGAAPTSTSPPSSSSNGAVIGGAVAGVAVGIAVTALAIFLLFKRRRRQPRSASSGSAKSRRSQPYLAPYYDAEDRSKMGSPQPFLSEAYVPPPELDGSGRWELASR